MSESLPTVSGKQLIRALERQGWYVKRIRGSHHVLRHPEIPDALPVPGPRQQANQAGHASQHPQDDRS
ncbi:MAG: type II toxin-antitoxin system HicA family toxin [Thermoleophilia bacterium]|nr:type II toxin-antitoxin system HicA family toxin [Thermoleophilia bacterium]